MRVDLSVYLVTDPGLCATYGLERTVKEAVEGGVSLVQLRDKTADDLSLIAQARRLKSLLAGTDVPLIINDRLEVAVQSGADGLHLGQSDTTIDQARATLGERAILGLSVHDPGELKAAQRLPLDYVGLGPVFATQSKPDHEAPIGLDGLAAMMRDCPLPAVAIGGLTLDQVEAVYRAGAQGMAVVSAICGQRSPRDAAAALFRRWADVSC